MQSHPKNVSTIDPTLFHKSFVGFFSPLELEKICVLVKDHYVHDNRGFIDVVMILDKTYQILIYVEQNNQIVMYFLSSTGSHELTKNELFRLIETCN